MKRLGGIIFFGLFVPCVVTLSGCAPKQKVLVSPAPERQVEKSSSQGAVPEERLEAAPVAPSQGPGGAGRGDARSGQLFSVNLDHVKQRLALYEAKLFGWNTLDQQLSSLGLTDTRPAGWLDCKQRLQRTYSAYSRLRDQMLQVEDFSGVAGEQPGVFDAYWEDIGYLESGCEAVFESAKSGVSSFVNQISAAAAAEMEAMVVRDLDSGKYGEAVAAYRKLRSTYPERQIGQETKMAYGLALVRSGQVDEAIRVLSEIEPDFAKQAGLLALRRMLGDLLFVNGQLDAARREYKGLTDFYASQQEDGVWVADQLALLDSADVAGPELAIFQEMLMSYLRFDGMTVPDELRAGLERLEAEYPESQFTSRARQILRRAEQDAGAWLERRMLQADALVAKKEFRKAAELLEGLLASELPAVARQQVQDTLDAVHLKEKEEHQNQELQREQAQAESWETANRLFGLRKYDEAIARFSTLLDTGYDEQARVKIHEAANLAAADMRRQAANIFVKARKSRDPEQQKELMLESWHLLHEIPEKYPQADILDKVAQNIKDLERQIRGIDPFLLGDLSSGGAADHAPVEEPQDKKPEDGADRVWP